MNRKLSERRALRLALQTYLASNWSDVKIKDSQLKAEDMSIPIIGISHLSSRGNELQVGRVNDKIYKRVIEFAVYMEQESRVDAICDDIMDFIDLTPIYIKDINDTTVGSLICYDTESISAETLPPILNNPSIIRWRGIVRATYEAHYPDG